MMSDKFVYTADDVDALTIEHSDEQEQEQQPGTSLQLYIHPNSVSGAALKNQSKDSSVYSKSVFTRFSGSGTAVLNLGLVMPGHPCMSALLTNFDQF